jgi:hypothetical protein
MGARGTMQSIFVCIVDAGFADFMEIHMELRAVFVMVVTFV